MLAVVCGFGRVGGVRLLWRILVRIVAVRAAELRVSNGRGGRVAV